MSRFYVPPSNVDKAKNRIYIGEKEGHHILDVMRMSEGDKVVVFDGTGNEYSGFIEKVNAKNSTLVVEIIKTEKPAAGRYPDICLAQAVPKKNRMDYIVEKSTELGVRSIVPMITARTVVRPDNASAARKVERWRKIAVESAKQCGRTDIPDIKAMKDYGDIAAGLDDYDMVLFACLEDDTIPLKEALTGFGSGKILVLVGPEGDFTADEKNMAGIDSCKFVSLGKRVLKSDTAGLFILSAIGYEFPDHS